MPMYQDADELTILEAVTAVLRSKLNLNDRRCYITLPDLAFGQMPPGGDYWLEVGPGDSRAPEDFQVGGGANQTVEFGTVTVTIFNRVKLDAANKARSLLEASRRGLWRIKRQVIAALTDEMLTDDAGNYILMSPIHFMGAMTPRYDEQSGVASLTCLFSVDWDWGDTLATDFDDE